jgi:hypothetical protein
MKDRSHQGEVTYKREKVKEVKQVNVVDVLSVKE